MLGQEKYLDKVHEWLRDPFYAGFIEYKSWDVAITKGKHEGIISFETYEQIQRRLGKVRYIRKAETLLLRFRGKIAIQ